jgi:hypothetical protein
MSDTDLIILVIFLICVAYVVRRAIEDLDDQTKFEFDKSSLETQLDEKTLGETKLKDIVEVGFRFEHRYKFSDQPKFLSATIKNKSPNVHIYADWDKSTITNYENASRRLIRLNADKQLTSTNLPIGSQLANPITPGNSLSVQLTAEEVVKKNAEANVLEPQVPLIDLADLEKRAKDKVKKPTKALKDMHAKFDDRQAPLEFSIRLMLRMNQIDLEGKGESEYQYPLWCKFKVHNMHWWDQIPWNPKPKP